jgi:chromatin structure-remodeling complex subunit RSC9
LQSAVVLTLTRRTILDREPKVGSRHIDLLRLYKRVNAEGGYDKVSDTKGNKLAWRRLAGEFLPGSANLTTQAFLVKTAYYKNLAYATHCKLLRARA